VYSRAERVFILEHYLSSKPFPAVREAFPLHSLKPGAWFAVSRRRIMGAQFLQTINAERYQNLLAQFISLLEENESDC
jgi:hypothetical protein